MIGRLSLLILALVALANGRTTFVPSNCLHTKFAWTDFTGQSSLNEKVLHNEQDLIVECFDADDESRRVLSQEQPTKEVVVVDKDGDHTTVDVYQSEHERRSECRLDTMFCLIKWTVSTHVAEIIQFDNVAEILSREECLSEGVAREEQQHRMEGISRFYMVMVGFLLSMVAWNPSEWISTTVAIPLILVIWLVIMFRGTISTMIQSLPNDVSQPISFKSLRHSYRDYKKSLAQKYNCSLKKVKIYCSREERLLLRLFWDRLRPSKLKAKLKAKCSAVIFDVDDDDAKFVDSLNIDETCDEPCDKPCDEPCDEPCVNVLSTLMNLMKSLATSLVNVFRRTEGHNTVQIYVTKLNGDSVVISVKLTDTVSTLKNKISDAVGIPPAEQQLTFGGRPLNDNATMLDCNIQKQSTLDLSLRLPGGEGGKTTKKKKKSAFTGKDKQNKHPPPSTKKKKSTPQKKKKSSRQKSKAEAKAEAEAAAAARAKEAEAKYNSAIPMAEKLVEQDKFLEALKAYHSALSNRALPEGCAKSSVLNKMFRIISELNLECKSSADFETVKLLLLCIEDCIFYANRDNIEGCDVTSFRHIYVMILLKVMQCKIDGKEAALYYGLVMKNVKSLETSLQTTYKTKAIKFLKRRRDQFSYSTNHKYSILELLECINTKADLLSSAKNIRRKKPQQGTVEYILYKLMLLGEKEMSDEDFESEFDKLRNKLGKLLTTKTGRVINLGNGLSAEHVLFVMMNYATPKTKSWNGSEWTYDTMKPTEGCIRFWRQSVITCLEREVGIEKTSKHKSSCISTQDRLFWACNTNKSDYVEEIDDVCDDADISEDTMHLIPIILLALKVKYARMNGHMPSILAMGGPVRDNLFEVDDTLITRQAIFAGCVPHSEMFMRKDRFLSKYSDIRVQHKYSQRLAVFYSQQFSTTSECTFTENWTGLGNLSPDEMEEFREEHRKLMQEIGSRGGMTTGELAQLASALYAVDWNHDDLSPVMQLRFAWCLEHKNRHKKKNKFDEDDFIEFLTKLRKSRVKGGKKGGKTSGEMTMLASELHKVDDDYNELSPEWKFIFELHMARKKIDEDEFIKFLTELRGSRVKNGKTTGEMAKLASVLDDDEVDGDYNKLSPEWKFIFELHMARKKIDEKAFIKILKELLGSRKKGAKTTNDMRTLAAKLKDANGDYNKLSPELRLVFDLIHASYNNRHKNEKKNQTQFIEFLKEMNNNQSVAGAIGGAVKSDVKTKQNGWNTLHKGKSDEEKTLIEPLINIIEPVVAGINFTKRDKLGGANDKLLEENLLAALHKYDKTNPINVKSILWCSTKHPDYKEDTNRDKSGSIRGEGGEYIDFNYFQRTQYVVKCDSSTLGRGLSAKSRAQIEMSIIIRVLLNAKITHHRNSTEEKRRVYILDLLKTVVERRSKKRKRN